MEKLPPQETSFILFLSQKSLKRKILHLVYANNLLKCVLEINARTINLLTQEIYPLSNSRQFFEAIGIQGPFFEENPVFR